jgi:biopolymer transport protein ExbB
VWAFLDDFAIDFVHLALKSGFVIGRSNAPVTARSHDNQSSKANAKTRSNDDQFAVEVV